MQSPAILWAGASAAVVVSLCRVTFTIPRRREAAPKVPNSHRVSLSTNRHQLQPQSQTRRNMRSLLNKSGRWSFPASSANLNRPTREHFCLLYSTCFVRLIDRSYLATHLNPASSGQNGGRGDAAMSAIEASLAALKEASALAKKIPFIGPVAGLLLQALTMRDASLPLLSQ
jgi:hypothetical protein